MNENDTSAEAFEKWAYANYPHGMPFATMEVCWREAVRRAAAEVSEWMIANHWATGHGDDIRDLLKELNWQIEEMVKKAVAARHEAAKRALEWAWERRGNACYPSPQQWEYDLMVEEFQASERLTHERSPER